MVSEGAPAGARFFAAYDAAMRRWPLSVDRLDVTTGYGRTRVNACGAAHAPALVLLPGGGISSAQWFANVAALARLRRVYAVDLVGDAGRSACGGRPLRGSADVTAWFTELLAGLGVPRVDLAGHSYGARMAVHCALTAPQAVGRLALCDPTTVFAGFRPGYLRHALPALIRPSGARVRRFLRWETGGVELDPDWLELAVRSSTDFAAARPVLFRRPREAELRGLAAPTCVVLAGQSRTHDAARVAARARAVLPAARVTVLAGVSHHAMPWYNADALNAELTAFLAADA